MQRIIKSYLQKLSSYNFQERTTSDYKIFMSTAYAGNKILKIGVIATKNANRETGSIVIDRIKEEFDKFRSNRQISANNTFISHQLQNSFGVILSKLFSDVGFNSENVSRSRNIADMAEGINKDIKIVQGLAETRFQSAKELKQKMDRLTQAALLFQVKAKRLKNIGWWRMFAVIATCSAIGVAMLALIIFLIVRRGRAARVLRQQQIQQAQQIMQQSIQPNIQQQYPQQIQQQYIIQTQLQQV